MPVGTQRVSGGPVFTSFCLSARYSKTCTEGSYIAMLAQYAICLPTCIFDLVHACMLSGLLARLLHFNVLYVLVI